MCPAGIPDCHLVLGMDSASTPYPPSSCFPQAWSPLWCRSRSRGLDYKILRNTPMAPTVIGSGEPRAPLRLPTMTCIGHPACHAGFTPWALQAKDADVAPPVSGGCKWHSHRSDGSVIKSACCSQLTPVPWDPTSAGLWPPGTHVHIHVYRQNIQFLEKNGS